MIRCEKTMVEAFDIKNYKGDNTDKLALVEVSAKLFLATDYKLGKPEQKEENFKKIYGKLIEAKKDDSMNIALASKMFGLSQDALMDASKARIWYEGNKDKFDSVYSPLCEFAINMYPELDEQKEGRSR